MKGFLTLFVCLVLCTTSKVHATCSSDSLALVALYNVANGANWTNVWELNAPFSQWYGVETNPSTGCVIGLNLSGNDLLGTLPLEMAELSSIKILDLSYNSLLDSIPAEFGNLANLKKLDLSFNNLTGNLPPELGAIENLEELHLSSNNFTGNIPTELGNLVNLKRLYLSLNSLTGAIPDELGNLNNLLYLYLSYNELSGSIPTTFDNLTALTHLYLNDNQLTFAGLSHVDWGNIDYFSFSTQANIPIYEDGVSIYTDVGEDISNNTYYWYHEEMLTDVIQGDSVYMPYREGTYTCIIERSIGTNQFYLNSLPVYVESRVLPGDMNYDGSVNYLDVLYGGLAIETGSTGPMRPLNETGCTIVESDDWSNIIAGVNGKHQDADGNGIAELADMEIISQNYNCSVPDTTTVPVIQSDLSFEIIGNDTIIEGSTAHVFNVYINGTDSLSGIAFNFDYSGVPNIAIPVNQNNIIVDAAVSWLDPSFVLSSPSLTENTIDLAMVRTDGVRKKPDPDTPVIRIVIIEDLIGFLQSDILVSIPEGVAMRLGEPLKNIIGFDYEDVEETTVVAVDDISEVSNNDISNIYPTVPSSEDIVNIHFNSTRHQEAELLVMNMHNGLIGQQTIQLQASENHIKYSVQHLPAGSMYIIQIKGKNWVSSPKKILKM